MSASRKRPRSDSDTEDSDIEAPQPEPVVFFAAGLKPDVRLSLFNIKEFHVHSVVLKLHSNYFRKFLDSPDKSGEPASASFQYEYTAVMDEDGNDLWALEPLASAKKAVNHDALCFVDTTEQKEVELFEKLLCAMYNRPYKVDRFDTLDGIVRLADFYRALPIVSATLTGNISGHTLFTSTSYYRSLRFDKLETQLILSAKLRHALLFRETLIHVVSRWDRGKHSKRTTPCKTEQIPHLLNIVRKHKLQLSEKMLDVNNSLVMSMMTDTWTKDDFIDGEYNILNDLLDDAPLRHAFSYRILLNNLDSKRVLDRASSSEHIIQLHGRLRTLLKSYLVLDNTRPLAGEGFCGSAFLCTDIKDDDLPWDLDEVDW